jgi:hypothetical protein
VGCQFKQQGGRKSVDNKIIILEDINTLNVDAFLSTPSILLWWFILLKGVASPATPIFLSRDRRERLWLNIVQLGLARARAVR